MLLFVIIFASLLLLSVCAWAIFTPLEILLPRSRANVLARIKGVPFAIVQSAAAAVVIGLTLLVWRALHLPHLITEAPLAVRVIASVLIGDFFYYWCHRAQHRWFWRFHAVHHSIRDMSAINSYHHVTEELIRLPFVSIPMALLFGANVPAFTILGLATAVQGFFIHSPTVLNLGWLRAVVGDNRYHRIHHSLDEAHFDKNFAAFCPVWDVIFGTARFPRPGEWPAVGLADQAPPDTVGDYVLARKAAYISSESV